MPPPHRPEHTANLPEMPAMQDTPDMQDAAALLQAKIRQAIAAAGGWLPFDAFMQLALYEPDLGYYSRSPNPIGRLPAQGSDFATAPEISPLFGQALAVQIGQALAHTGVDTVYEFGAGNGTLARQILRSLGARVARYCIVDTSAALRERQAQTLAAFGPQVQWLDALPPVLEGVLLGNEVLDAMPVKLLVRQPAAGPASDRPAQPALWDERGVALQADGSFCWQDRPSTLHPPVDPFEGDSASHRTSDRTADSAAGFPGSGGSAGFSFGHLSPLDPLYRLAAAQPPQPYVTEIHPWAQAFIRTTSERLRKGAALWIDYGFGEAEYYHRQRHMGTLACHYQHRMDDQPLQQIGHKDITSHIDFTAMAVAAQDAGLHVLGYTSQAHFLINCGIHTLMEHASLAERTMAAKLLHEHEMGELFKVLMLGPGPFWEPLGFANGDRTHTL